MEELFAGNEATRRGQALEPVARRAYELCCGVAAPPCDFVTHPKHVWMGATPDGLIGERGLLEIKCPMHRAHTELPPHYMAQVQGQLEITGRTWVRFVSSRSSRRWLRACVCARAAPPSRKTSKEAAAERVLLPAHAVRLRVVVATAHGGGPRAALARVLAGLALPAPGGMADTLTTL